jgi:pimeloyl-ACP methyl ester carboxylesterase
MKRIYSFLFFLLLISNTVSNTASAEVMLLIHGYLGDANSWEKSGINNALDQSGWKRAGMFRGSPQGPKLYLTKNNKTNKQVYVATLPSNAPVMFQADTLKAIIDQISQRHKKQKIILVGHSAGGVVARMALIRHKLQNISALITIASPHLGTARANQALNITANHGPFNIVKNVVGGDDYNALKHSRALMIDLLPPRPGNMLDWLNNQTHPKINYSSIIRSDNNGKQGDFYVPGFSQNMNNVNALQNRSSTYVTSTSHFLTQQDAHTIISIIEQFKD